MNPPIVVMANGKGGCGKSTTSLVTTQALAQAKIRVGWHDTDRQQTLAKAMALETNQHPLIRPYRFDPRDLDIVITDSPPRLDEAPFLRALDVATFVVVVVRPSLQDLWGAQESIAEVRRRHPLKPLALLVNAVREDRAISRHFRELIASTELSSVTLLDVQLSDYASYQNVFSGGWESLTEPAKTEARALARTIHRHACEKNAIHAA